MSDKDDLVTVEVPVDTTSTTDETVTTATPQTNNEHVENASEVGTTVQEQNPVQDKSEENRLRELGKMSQLEKERNELRRQLEEAQSYKQYAEAVEQISNTFREDPDAYEAFRKAQGKKGIQLPEYSEFSGQQTQPRNPNGQSQDRQPVIDKTQLFSEFQQRMEQERVNNEFFKLVPEMHPQNLSTQEERQNAYSVYEAIIGPAQYEARTKGIPLEQALANNYTRLVKGDEAVEQARQKGEVIGKQKAFVNGSGTGTTGYGGSDGITGTTTYKLTPDQNSTYQRFIAEGKPKLAKIFAEQAERTNNNRD